MEGLPTLRLDTIWPRRPYVSVNGGLLPGRPQMFYVELRPYIPEPRYSRVALFLDTSLSMAGRRAFNVKNLVARMARSLVNTGVEFLIYKFCKRVDMVGHVSPETGYREMVGRILDLELCEGTNYVKLVRSMKNVGADTVLVFTDGLPSIGVRSPEKLASIVARENIDLSSTVFVLVDADEKGENFVARLSEYTGSSMVKLTGDEDLDSHVLTLYAGGFDYIPYEAVVEVPPWASLRSSTLPVRRTEEGYAVKLQVLQGYTTGRLVFESALEEEIDLYIRVILYVLGYARTGFEISRIDTGAYKIASSDAVIPG